MSAFHRLQRAAGRRRENTSRFWLPAVLAALVVFLQGCAVQQPQHVKGPDVSDPNAPVPSAGYRSVIGGYESRRPVAPAPWRERNESVTPKSKGGGQ